MGRPRVPLEERLWSRINKDGPGGCWIYTGYITNAGYGQIGLGGAEGGRSSTHRLVYTLLAGPIPDGLGLDHVCHTRDQTCRGGSSCLHRRCCNPRHLEPVTARENVHRGRTPRFVIGETCIRGHVLTEAMIYVQPSNGNRTCKKCMRIRTREWVMRQRHAAKAGHVTVRVRGEQR